MNKYTKLDRQMFSCEDFDIKKNPNFRFGRLITASFTFDILKHKNIYYRRCL